jgi:molybdenum cofactor cytidylyltransferase
VAGYGDVVLEHFRRPRNRGVLAWPSFSREATNPLCGDRIRIEGRVAGDRVVALAFVGDACAICVAAASLLTEAAPGRTIDACAAFAEEAVLEALETEIPPARRRCATLPVEALRGAACALRDGYTTAILLAAGRGSRFGGGKLLSEVDGLPIVRLAAEAVLAARPAEMLVVRSDADALLEGALVGLPVRFALVPAGLPLAASLHAGLTARSRVARRVLVALGDQPRIDAAAVRRVVDAPDASIVVPSYRGVRGHPVRFDVALLPELLEIEGDRGAREVVARDPSRVLEIAVDADAPSDVDTTSDLARLREGAAPPPA